MLTVVLIGSNYGADSYEDDLSARSPWPRQVGRSLDGQYSSELSQEDLATFTLQDCRLPAEFEHQGALLVACHELISTAPEVLVQLVTATRGRVPIIALVTSIEEHEAVMELLRSHAVVPRHVHFVELNHDTMWARDYGPSIVELKDGRPIVIDTDYDLSRSNDDGVPNELAQLLNLDVVRLPLRLDGGNLISNGDGLAMTTYRLVEENAGQADIDALCSAIGRGYGVKEVAILEPLAGELTGHVDMFATFTSENTVVVGQIDPEVDAENAEILDRNADHLATIQTSTGMLRVVRIPMPSHDDGVWRTYTNVIFANGALLVPTYSETNHGARRVQAQALSTYAKLMPGWKIVGIDATRIIEANGALHCITMNLGPLGPLPEFPPPQTRAANQLEFVDTETFWLSDLERDGGPLPNASYLGPKSSERFVASRRCVPGECHLATPIRYTDNHEYPREAATSPVSLDWSLRPAPMQSKYFFPEAATTNRFPYLDESGHRPITPPRAAANGRAFWNPTVTIPALAL